MASICACLQSRDGQTLGWPTQASIAAFRTSLQEKFHFGSRAEDVDLQQQAMVAPIDDAAALKVLGSRGLLEDLEAAWVHGGGASTDASWLERVVVGKLRFDPGRSLMGQQETFLGFLLCSEPVCDGRSRGSISELSAMQGEFWWPQFAGTRHKLEVNRLHLLPVQGTSTTAAISFDLGEQMKPPTLSGEVNGEVSVTIDLGPMVADLVVFGQKPAQRWAAGVRLGLMNSLQAAAELPGPLLLQELEAWDGVSEGASIGNAIRAQQTIFTDLATAIDRQGTAVHMEGGLDLPTMAKKLASCPSLEIEKFTDALKRVAQGPRTLLTAAAHQDPPRLDVLEFWQKWHHKPWCRALEMVWDARCTTMSPADLLKVAKLVGAYDTLLSTISIDDISLTTSLDHVAEVYGRRSFANLGNLAEHVAALALPELIEDNDAAPGTSARCWGTSAPVDLLVFLGPTCEVVLEARPELATRAVDVIDGVLLRFQKALVARLQAERRQYSAGHYRELVAALMGDAECFARRCKSLMAAAGSSEGEKDGGAVKSSAVHGHLKICQERFTAAMEGYCECLVTAAFHTAGVMAAMGTPLCSSAVMAVDLKTLLHDNITLIVSKYQETLSRSAKRSFALRVLGRLVALDLHAIMQATSSPVPPEKLAAKLLEHATELTDAAESWVGKEGAAAVAEKTLALREVASLLQVGADGIAEQTKRMRSAFGDSFNANVLQALLALRTVPESARNAAMAATRRASVKAPKSLNFMPTCEASVLAAGGALLHWATDQAWIEQAANLGAEAVEEVEEEEDDLDLDAFLDKGGSSEDDMDELDLDSFLNDGDGSAQPGVDDAAERLRQERAAARKSRRSSAHRMAKAAAAAAAATSIESPSNETDAAEGMKGYLHMFSAAELVEDMQQNSVSNKLMAATRKAMNTAKGKLAAGWQQAYFVVKKNARLARVLTWYRKLSDKIPKGSLPIADIDHITEVDTGDAALPYELVITCMRKRAADDAAAKPREVLLRTSKLEDRTAWTQALQKLMTREAARSPSKVAAQKTGSVLTLKDTLHLPDPDHHASGQSPPDEPA